MGQKASNQADWAARIGRAVAYMESRLSEPFSLPEAAETASFSFFHFHRVFSAVMGVAPGEYLRMRRLTEGARLLVGGKEPVARIARAVGFGSLEAFHRSFKAEFGKTPAEYRRAGNALAVMNPFTPNDRPLAHRARCLAADPVVERFGPVRLLCASVRVGLAQPELSRGVNELWARVEPALAAACPAGASRFGLAEPEPGEEGSAIRYYAGAEWPGADVPESGSRSAAARSAGLPFGGAGLPSGLSPYLIPEGEYLRALHRGPASLLNETYLYLYGSWLPRLGREPALPMDFDEYGPGFDGGNPESPESEVIFRIPLRHQGQAGGLAPRPGAEAAEQ